MTTTKLPVPSFVDTSKADQVYRVDYDTIAREAKRYADEHGITNSAQDKLRIAVLGIDYQVTFCIPGFELFIGGTSGNAAVEDSIRFSTFIYENLDHISQIFLTMDTHGALAIFHPCFWVNADGNHPEPHTSITVEDVKNKTWRPNPAYATRLASGNYTALSRYAEHYVSTLASMGKYALTIWPYHAMLGGIGHAIAPIIEEAIFFHNIVRANQTIFEPKGNEPLTECYSVLAPEVLEDHVGRPVGQVNMDFIKMLMDHDRIVISGQAMSHCVAWTIADLLTRIDPTLANKIYLMIDATSPVVVPGVIDFTDEANKAFKKFEDAGMHVVRSTDPMETWPDMNLAGGK